MLYPPHVSFKEDYPPVPELKVEVEPEKGKKATAQTGEETENRDCAVGSGSLNLPPSLLFHLN